MKLIETFPGSVGGMIDYMAMYKEMTGEAPPQRVAAVKNILTKLRGAFPGEMTLEALADRFDATKSPLVRNGERSDKEAFYEFLNAWNTYEFKKTISFEEANEFFLDLSAGTQRNDFFDALTLPPLGLL